MSKKRQRRAAARAKALTKTEHAGSGRLELANVLRTYECDDETVFSWLNLCATRRSA